MKYFEAIVKDENHIELLKPLKIAKGKKIKVIIQEESNLTDERVDFLSFSLESLENAYGENEPEYSIKMIKEPNKEYGL